MYKSVPMILGALQESDWAHLASKLSSHLYQAIYFNLLIQPTNLNINQYTHQFTNPTSLSNYQHIN